jgi:hypothetical protein
MAMTALNQGRFCSELDMFVGWERFERWGVYAPVVNFLKWRKIWRLLPLSSLLVVRYLMRSVK